MSAVLPTAAGPAVTSVTGAGPATWAPRYTGAAITCHVSQLSQHRHAAHCVTLRHVRPARRSSPD